MMRLIIVAFAVSALCLACQNSKPADQGGNESSKNPDTAASQGTPENTENHAMDSQANESMPGSEAESEDPDIVLTSGDIRLTTADYKTCVAAHLLMGQNVSERILANSRFQRDELQRCFQIAVMRRYADEHQIQISSADRQKTLKLAFERNGVQSEAALMQKLSITQQELDRIIDNLNMQSAMQQYLAMNLDEAAAKESFRKDWRRYDVELAGFDNEPTADEVAQFLVDYKDLFSSYLGSHPALLNTSPRAEFVRMAYAKNGEGQNKAEELQRYAAQNGIAASLDYCRKSASSGCIVLNDESRTHSVERTDNTAWAFRIAVGAVPDVIHSAEYDEVWILQAVHAPEVRNTKEPKTRAWLGAQVMKETTPAPHLLSVLKPALEAKDADFKAVTESNHGEFQEFKDAAYLDLTENKSILSRKVLDVLGGIESHEAMLFSNPIVENGKMYIFRVTRIGEVSDDDFRQHQSEWRQRKASSSSLDLVQLWLEENMPRMSSINIRPIQKEYGILRRDGTIR